MPPSAPSTHILGVDVVALAECHAQSPSTSRGTLQSVQAVQSAHRLRILEAWLHGDGDDAPDLAPLKGRILETGCGQGDQTAALAAFLVASQHSLPASATVLGVDPGRPDYGAPFTLHEAQQHLLRHAPLLRQHLAFAPLDGSDAKRVLESQPAGAYRTVVASMCLWYFARDVDVGVLFETAHKSGVEYVLLSEWALKASSLNAVPHVLAVLLQAMYPITDGNVRTVLSIDDIKRLAERAGWRVQRERVITPHAALHDGRWEADAALQQAESTIARLGEAGHPTTALYAAMHSLRQSLPAQGLKAVECMDMWTAVLVRA